MIMMTMSHHTHKKKLQNFRYSPCNTIFWYFFTSGKKYHSYEPFLGEMIIQCQRRNYNPRFDRFWVFLEVILFSYIYGPWNINYWITYNSQETENIWNYLTKTWGTCEKAVLLKRKNLKYLGKRQRYLWVETCYLLYNFNKISWVK